MKKLIVLLSFALLQGCSSAPKWNSVNEVGQNFPAFEKKMVFDHIDGSGRADGKGYIPYFKAMKNPPKRVALVSVYAIDPANTQTSGDWQTTRWLTTEGAKTAANALYTHSAPAIKEEFAKHGMELITPDVYLADNAKKEFYTDFTMKKGSINSAASGVTNFLRGIANHHDPIMQQADGFNGIFVENSGKYNMGTMSVDDAMVNSLGSDLAKGLGVDAVLVIYSQYWVAEKATIMTEANMAMFGPNPVKGDELASGADTGMYYGGVRSTFENVYLGTDTGNPDDYKGYAPIFSAMSAKLGTYLEEQTRL